MTGERLAELGHFLRDRRARLLPADAGLPPTTRRRVRGLRREEVAALAGIGVSWYTSLENGTARGVSEATLLAVARVLRLSESERHYITALASDPLPADADAPGPLVVATMNALTIPAYLTNATWNVHDCNAAFRKVWEIGDAEGSFNAIERLFLHPRTRQMHGEQFLVNIAPVIAKVRSGFGRYPNLETLHRVRDRLLAEAELKKIWDAYEISSPFTPTHCTIESGVGSFRYEPIDLNVPGNAHGLVVQVPDAASRERLVKALA